MTAWAVVLAVAMALEGEAGVLGAPGMHMVVDSMLARLESPEHPDQWDGVLAAYYGSAPPSSEALSLAYAAVTVPWPSKGMPYAVSREDALRLGLRVDVWHCRGGYCVGLARQWAGE